MVYFENKPDTLSFTLGTFPVFKTAEGWKTLHLNGIGYYGLLVDGRSVYGMAKKLGKIEEFKNAVIQ